MTTTSDFSSEFITTDIAHRDCEACAGCADRARAMAKVTGSVGATESTVIGPNYDRVEHYATVHRADRMHELHHAAMPEPPARPSVHYVTFGLGGPARGLFTMVVVDAGHPDPAMGVRQAAHAAYGREWAFTYPARNFTRQIEAYELKQREVIRVKADGTAHIV